MKITKGSRVPYLYDSSQNYVIGDFYHNGGETPIGTYELDDRIMRAIVEIFHFFTCSNKVMIMSAYRSIEHNKAVGGLDKSAHLRGQAVDFYFQKNNNFSNTGALGIVKDNFAKQGTLFRILLNLGIGEIEFHETTIHIGIVNHGGLVYVINEYANTNQTTIAKKEQKAIALLPISKDYNEYYYQDSSLNTINKLFSDSNSIISRTQITQKELLEYKNKDGVRNLDRIWELYTDTQKSKFADGYSLLTNNDKRKYRPTYTNVDYDMPVGALLSIPNNRINLEVFFATGKNLFMEQQDLKAFMGDELKTLINDPTFIQTQKLTIVNNQYSVNYLYIAFSVWIYLRTEDKILNISPFVKSVDTTVADGGGTFNISLNEINSLEDIRKYSETYYSYIQKTESGKYNLSFFEKNVQQNDIVWIRFERLDIEGKVNIDSSVDLFVDKSSISNTEKSIKVYDMIGLVDISSEAYSSSTNEPIFNVSGRDFTKLLIEDSSIFLPWALVNGAQDMFLNLDVRNTIFKRVSADKTYQTFFTQAYRSIRDSIGFIFNQLTNVGVLPKGNNLFDSYKNSYDIFKKITTDRTSEVYDISNVKKDVINESEQNGVWKIIKAIVDHQIDDRRLNNGELTAPEGAIIDLVMRMCQEPFVEFWGDTIGDQFIFMARQPPFTRKQIEDYFQSNNYITVTADKVTDFDLSWDETYYTMYQLDILNGLVGVGDLISASNMPLVYFEEYANLFGMHKKVVPDSYLTSSVLSGSNKNENLNVFRISYANDMKFLIETNAILPFTRKGRIVISGGDRRIKKGMWILFEPTNEICYVKSVTNSVNVSGNDLNRTTVLIVERCMLKEFVLGGSGITNKTNGKENNYFDIVNIDVIYEGLIVGTKDTVKVDNKTATNKKLINTELFEFFSKRQQWK